LEDLYRQECPHCLEESIEDFIKSGYAYSLSILNDVIEDIVKGSNEIVPEKLYGLYYNNLQKAIRQVFNPDSGNIRDLDYLYKFEANAAKFAAYKANYVNRTLLKAKELKPGEFSANAKRILKTFNRFQVAEYNTAIARARTARQLSRFERNADIYPNLEWLKTSSSNPRELHLSYVGLILPINDPFWNENQPGNLYNCKCNWRQTNKPATQKPKTIIVSDKGLEGNPYKTREAYTEQHPYFKKADKSQIEEIDKFVSDRIFTQFRKVKEYENGAYFAHPLQNKNAPDYKDLLIISRLFAKRGNNAYIMPKLSSSKGDLYNYLYKQKGAYINKNPDLLINNMFYEFESYTGNYSNGKLGNMLSRAVRQSDRIIIDVRGADKISNNYIRRRINERISEGQKITEAWILKNGDILEKAL
jgi:hypothetical protein